MSFHIRVNARGIVINNDRILLNEFGGGEYYNIPGGGVEPGETIPEAVAREVLEETGIRVTVGELIYVLEYEPVHCNYMFGNTPSLSLVYRCFLAGDDRISPPTIPDVIMDRPDISCEAKWIPIADLESTNYFPRIHEQLMEYLKTGRFSPVFMEEPIKKYY